jgi:heparin binding hemagglutinin HbhA
MTLPKNDDVRKAGEQAVAVANTAIEQVRTPLLAALGAGDLAAKAVLEAVGKAKDEVTEKTEAARTAAQDLPGDLRSLRGKLDPAELRKAVEEYTDAALKLYRKLADQGEEALDKFKAQPQVRKIVDQLEEAIEAAQTRAGGVATDARELAEDVLAKVTRKTRSAGEKTARAAEKLADETAEKVEELGDDVAHEVRSTSRKVANRTAPVRKPAAKPAAAKPAAGKNTEK